MNWKLRLGTIGVLSVLWVAAPAAISYAFTEEVPTWVSASNPFIWWIGISFSLTVLLSQVLLNAEQRVQNLIQHNERSRQAALDAMGEKLVSRIELMSNQLSEQILNVEQSAFNINHAVTHMLESLGEIDVPKSDREILEKAITDRLNAIFGTKK